MVKRFPHTIQFVSAGTPSVQNPDKTWTPGSSGQGSTYPCRYETNGSIQEYVGTDGTTIQYTGVVFLPNEVPVIARGVSVTLLKDNVAFATEVVKRYVDSQLDNYLFV